jgi:hypothetical protein
MNKSFRHGTSPRSLTFVTPVAKMNISPSCRRFRVKIYVKLVPALLIICSIPLSTGWSTWIQYLPDELPGNAWYSKILDGMNEPSLFERKSDRNVVSFRFLWLRSFHNPIAVRIEETPNGIKGRLVRLDGRSGYHPGQVAEEREFLMTAEQWKTFEQLISTAGFWGMSSPEYPGFDGSEWIIEGLRGGTYHVVKCWTPQWEVEKRRLKPFRDLGKFFLEAAKVAVPPKEFY